MKFVISGKEYPVERIGKFELADLIVMHKRTGITADEAERLILRLDKVNPDQFLRDDEGLLGLALLVWLGRRRAGETDLTLEQACAFPLDELAIISEPGDDPKPASTARPTKATPKASGRGGANRGRSGSPQRKTSKSPSADG